MSDYYRKFWADKLDRRFNSLKNGCVTIEWVRTKGDTGRIFVFAPEREEFRVGALDLGGEYRFRTQRWSFPADKLQAVVNLCSLTYGRNMLVFPGFSQEARDRVMGV